MTAKPVSPIVSIIEDYARAKDFPITSALGELAIANNQFYSWKSGKTWPSRSTVSRLAPLLGVDADSVISRLENGANMESLSGRVRGASKDALVLIGLPAQAFNVLKPLLDSMNAVFFQQANAPDKKDNEVDNIELTPPQTAGFLHNLYSTITRAGNPVPFLGHS